MHYHEAHYFQFLAEIQMQNISRLSCSCTEVESSSVFQDEKWCFEAGWINKQPHDHLMDLPLIYRHMDRLQKPPETQRQYLKLQLRLQWKRF